MEIDPRILVTGGNGQLGRAFASMPGDIHVLSRSDLDITDRSAVLRKLREMRPKIVINAAAFTQVDEAETHQAQAALINDDAVEILASSCRETGSKLVQLSTDYVFDGLKTQAYTEDDPTSPRSVYGRTKLAGEHAALQLEGSLVVRTSWVFGDGANFVRTIVAAATKYPSLDVVDDQRGLPTYSVDLAEGILQLCRAGVSGVVHLAGGPPPCTWADLAETAMKSAGLDSQVRRVTTDEYYADKPGPMAPRPPNSVLDCAKAAALGVGLRPWPEAVDEYVRRLA